MIPLEQTVWMGLILFSGSLLQSTIGFGYTLFALPLLVWLGLPLSSAVAIVAISNFVQGAVGAYRLRQHIPWRTIWYANVLRYLAIPLGIWVLLMVDGMDQNSVKALLGVLLILILAIQWLWKVQPQEKLHWGWGWLAFLSSGFLQGLAAIGGPPIVLWVMAHQWDNPTSRVILFALLVLSIPFQLILLYLNYGSPILSTFLLGTLFTPIVALGSALGIRLGNKIAKPKLRIASYWMLFIIALVSIMAPLF